MDGRVEELQFMAGASCGLWNSEDSGEMQHDLKHITNVLTL